MKCRNVSFAYGTSADEQVVLQGLDLEVAAGRSVGVVGRTGSGKTTFSRLLLRLVDPTTGVVSLGGMPIRDMSLSELRRRVALGAPGGRALRGHDPRQRHAVRRRADR